MSEKNTAQQQWLHRRLEAVQKKYSAYQCLHEHGHGEELVDEETAISIFCPFHPNTKTPAARYYPSDGNTTSHVHCWGSCHASWDSINLFMKFKGVSFMDALRTLERRYNIHIEQRPDGPPIEEPKDRSSANYTSDAWQDVPRVLAMLEGKLFRLKDTASFSDYVKFCRVLDVVQYDLDKNKGVQTIEMAEVLTKLRDLMNSCIPSNISLD